MQRVAVLAAVFGDDDHVFDAQRTLLLALPSAPVTEIERLNLDRARQVPRLSVVTLVGTPEEGATAVLDQLSAVRD